MNTFSLTEGKTKTRYFVISILLVLFICPLAAIAEEDQSIATLRQMGKAFAKIAEDASPAVVGIKVEKVVEQENENFHGSPHGSPYDDDFFDYFFRRRSPNRGRRQQRPRQMAQGSGFIISADGYILTNNHLVGDAETVSVQLRDKQKPLKAEVIGTDPDSDVAVIKIKADDLTYLELADSDVLEVGEWVIAIGNPFGLSHTVTAGIVSAKGRNAMGINAYEDFIQTDAAINPGNSGGPLLNLDGKVIGINTAIISRSGGNMGIGLAIPVNLAKAVYTQLVESGTVTRGWLGVAIQDLTPELAKAFDLEITRGVLLSDITKDSAADKAGLKQGDVVIEFQDKAVENKDEFRNRVALNRPGSKVKIVVMRDNKRKTLTVKLGERPSSEQLAAERGQPQKQDRLGLTVQNLTEVLAERLGFEGLSGVVITEVKTGTPAAEIGLRDGILIQQVNRKRIRNIKDFNKAIDKVEKDESVVLLITDGRYSQYVLLPLQQK